MSEEWVADLEAIEAVESDNVVLETGGEEQIAPPSPPVRQHVRGSQFDEYLYQQAKAETPLGKAVEKGLLAGWMPTEELASDLRNAFEKHSPELQEVSADYTKNAQAIDTAMGLPEFQTMRELTVADEFASALAAAQFTSTLVEELVKQQDEEEETPPEPEHGDEEGDEADGESREEKEKKAAEERAERRALALRVAGRKAAKAASESIAEAEAAAQAFGGDDDARGYGFGQVRERFEGSMSERAKIARIVAANPRLQKIADMAGRMRPIASNAQRSRAEHIPDEIADIERGNNFARLLPTELLNLADPEMEDLFWMRWLDRGLMQYQLTGVEELKRGPIVLAVDESGSMRGVPADWAAGIALTLRQIAAKQGRDFAWVHGTGPNISLTDHYVKGRGTTERLVNSAIHFFGGGDDFDTPLDAALEMITQSQYIKADIICITDSVCKIDPSFLQQYLEIKREKQFSCFGLFIGDRSNNMKVFCDAYTQVVPGDHDVEALTAAFSV
jgi:uncharacterized protein with von Willebrand factor type A (vWA) domain